MSLLLYAVAENVEEAGLERHRLRVLGEDGLSAIVGVDAERCDEHSEENLWRHEQIVEQLMELGPILPARFGSVFSDESAARDSLRVHRDRLTASLALVRGASEVGLRAVWRDGRDRQEDGGGKPGTSYLLGRLARRRRAGELATVLAPLRGLARAERKRLMPRDGLALLGAYLVDHQQVREFARAVARLDRELDDVALICTGPWPPYTFAAEAGS